MRPDPARIRPYRFSLPVAFAAALLLYTGAPAPAASKTPPGGEKDAYYWFQKGLLGFEGKNYDQAIEDFGKAIRMEPENPTYRYQLAVVYFALARWEDSERELRSALKVNAYYSDAHNLLGAILAEKGDRPGALAEFQKVLSDKSYATPWKVWVNVALLYEQMGNLEEAVVSYRKALDAQNGYARAHYGLAQVLDRMGRLDEAIAEYKVASRDYETSPEFQYRVGLACFRAGRRDEAREHLNEVVRRAPGTTDASKAEDLLKLLE